MGVCVQPDAEAEVVVPLRLAARVLVGDLERVDGGGGGEEERPVRGVMSAAEEERVETIAKGWQFADWERSGLGFGFGSEVVVRRRRDNDGDLRWGGGKKVC